MAFITGITADPPTTITGTSMVSESIHFDAYRIDDGPLISEPLTAIRRYERGQLPRNGPDLAHAQRRLRNAPIEPETVIRVQAELSNSQWSWSYYLGKVYADSGLNDHLDHSLAASPAMYPSDELTIAITSDGQVETVLVPDRKRIAPFEIPEVGTISPVYSSRFRRDWDSLAKLDRGRLRVRFTGRYQSEPFEVGLFDGKTMRFEFWGEPATALRSVFGRAARAFLDCGSALSNEVALGMLRYYEATKAQFFEEDWEEYGIPRQLNATTVWDQVRFGDTLSFMSNSNDTSYVVIEGSCSWEPEHGLMLSFRGGDTLAKVSAYDGHPE